MELKDLYPFVFLMILTGMILGVGLLVFDNFGRVVRDPATVVNETFAASDATWADLAQSTITGSTATFANTTDVLSAGLFEFDSDVLYGADKVRLTTAGGLTAANGTNLNISYTYGSSSTATTILSSVSSAVGAIGTTWLALIVTVAVLAIILTLVMITILFVALDKNYQLAQVVMFILAQR